MREGEEMTDDWSLKGRQIEVPLDFVSYSLIRNGQRKFFRDDTIQTLRKKLIEDIEKLLECGKSHHIFYTIKDEREKKFCNKILFIINHRFGISEDEVKE